MAAPRRSRRRSVEAATIFALPGAAVLGGLVLFGTVSAIAALTAAVVLVVAAALLAVPHVRDLAALNDWTEELGIGEPQRSRWVGRTTFGADLALALMRARRRLERVHSALERRAAGAESVIDAVPEPLLVLDFNRSILHANLAAETLLGEDLVGRDLSEALRNPELLEAVGGTLHDGEGRAVEFDLALPVERQIRARIASLAQWRDTEGAVIVTLEDMTAIRRTEQMRVDFVANVSHELRTPIASLRGFIETLQGPARDDPEARDRFLGIMLGQAERMSRIVNDLLSLSRVELDEHNHPTDPVELLPLLRSVAASLELLAADRDMTIEIDAPERAPDVAGDADQLDQVFRNLIENAIKYGRQGTPVTVSLRTAPGGETVSVAVTDRGEGIERRHIIRLTERFYRVDTARSRELGGTGLGLAIVKHIVNRHRGRLDIETEVGVGSTFTVTLPAAAEPPRLS